MNFLIIAFILLLILNLIGNKKDEATNETTNNGNGETEQTIHPAEMQLR